MERARPISAPVRAFGLAAALAAAACAAWGGPVPAPRLRVGSGGTLHAGTTLRVEWDALPPATEEFELLLKIEEPAPLQVRLTESEDPALASLLWRVPDIPCTRARLLLRRGEEGAETPWALSEPFSIAGETVPGPEAPVARMVLRNDELWLESAPPARPQTLEADPRLAPAGPLSPLPAGALTGSKLSALGAAAGTAARPVSLRVLSAPLARGGRDRSPLRLQLRI